MEDIKVGDYIRAKYGIITQIETIKDTVVWTNEFIDIFHRYNEGIIEKRDIIKHSPNITDLIEKGDYVNGHLVVELSENAYGQKIVITEVDGKDGAIRHHYLERSIKSIVTKEQFDSIKYEV